MSPSVSASIDKNIVWCKKAGAGLRQMTLQSSESLGMFDAGDWLSLRRWIQLDGDNRWHSGLSFSFILERDTSSAEKRYSVT